MKSVLLLYTLGSVLGSAAGHLFAERGIQRRTVVSSGCQQCTATSWTIDPACATSGEWLAVASSIMNPPASVQLEPTAFCSEFLRPLTTQLTIVNVSGDTTIYTSTTQTIILYTPPSTTSTTTSSILTAKTIPTSTSKSKTKHTKPTKSKYTKTKSNTRTTSTTPIPTAKPTATPAQAAKLDKQDFTVPDYLLDWYFYGRVEPGCSCIVTSAGSSIVVSAVETVTSYSVTLVSEILIFNQKDMKEIHAEKVVLALGARDQTGGTNIKTSPKSTVEQILTRAPQSTTVTETYTIYP